MAGNRGIQALLDYADEILSLRKSALEDQWSVPDLPEEQPKLDYSIQYENKPPKEYEALSLDEIRVEMQREINSYLKSREKRPLLLGVPAGVGKTHVGISVAQAAAERDLRVAWFAQRKDTFDEDIANFPHFDQNMWYFWTAISGEKDGVPVCDYADAQMKWTSAGYISKDLCTALCKANGHYAVCPFIAQRDRAEPIIFARHNHLAVGVPMKRKFNVAIIDELPINAFIRERAIGVKRLEIEDAADTLKSMIIKIEIMGLTNKYKRISGAELFSQISDELDDIFARLEIKESYVYPQPPVIKHVDDVKDLQPFWLHDFLKIAAIEQANLIKGKTEWAERVWVSDGKLHMLGRNKVWDDLPNKKIILDATGDPAMYEKIFGSEPILYKPYVKRAGRIYQVAYRNNGKRAMLEDSNRSETLEIINGLVNKYQYKNVGIICHKDNENYFGEHYIKTRHFGALRGTNELEECDVLFVVGNQAANMDGIVKTALALEETRQAPFITNYKQIREDYILSPIGAERLKLEQGATSAWRLTGRYSDNTLETVARQARQAELEQAIHRSRVNKNANTTVWILSALPVSEPIDWLMEQPPLGPVGIDWKLWRKLDTWLYERYKNGQATDYDILCDEMEISIEWAREKNLLDKIVAFYPKMWCRPDVIIPKIGTKVIFPT